MFCHKFIENCSTLLLPNYSTVYPTSCTEQSQFVGTTCQFYCLQGTSISAGTSARTCMPDYTWSGLPIVCAITSRYNLAASY